MQCIHHPCGIRKPVYVKRFLSPHAILPAHPVQNDPVQSQSAASVFCRYLQDFLLTFVSFLRLYIAKGPLRQHGRFAGEKTISSYHPLRTSPIHKIKIQFSVTFRIQVASIHSILENHGAVGVHQYTVSLIRYQHGNGYFAVFLMHIHRLSS